MNDSKLKEACERARVRYSEQVPNSSEPFKSVDVIFCEELSPLFAEMESFRADSQALEQIHNRLTELLPDFKGCPCPTGWTMAAVNELSAQLQSERTAREAADSRVKELENENICDVCAGTGTPVSKRPCICRGSGKLSIAAQSLREMLYDEGKAKERAEKSCAEMRDGAWRALDWLDLDHLDAVQQGLVTLSGDAVRDMMYCESELRKIGQTPDGSDYIHRSELERVQKELAEVKGALVYVASAGVYDEGEEPMTVIELRHIASRTLMKLPILKQSFVQSEKFEAVQKVARELKEALDKCLEQLEVTEDLRKRDDGEWYWRNTGDVLITAETLQSAKEAGI